jgi:small-conductance mechanosensitive channel
MDSGIIDSLMYIAAGIVAAVIVHFIFILLKKRAERSATKLDDLFVHSLGAPLVILAFFVPLFFAIRNVITLYPQYEWFASSNVLFAAYIIVATWIVATFIDGVLATYGDALAETTETELDDQIVDILKRIAKYLIWFTGILYIFTLFNVNITPLIAGAGVIGIAIALAAQDLFSNFFGGAVIITDRPFKVGDRILINDILGDVVHIGPRSTRVVTLDADIVTIPNNKISTSVVRNYSLPSPQSRILIPVPVAADLDIEKVRSILMDIIDEAKKEKGEFIAENPGSTVYLMKMDKTAMTFEVTLFTHEYTYANIVRDYVNTKIIEAFRKEGIRFA